ncbi:hypothetical protein KAH94_04255 [bacterium]|nr:hypothetical protein [bacterium]
MCTKKKKTYCAALFAFTCLSASMSVRSECIVGRLCDGGVGVGCGSFLTVAGAAFFLLPGTFFYSRAMNDGSDFSKFCAATFFLSGAFITIGGMSIVLDGIKKFFGIKKRKKEYKIHQFVYDQREQMIFKTTSD